MKNQPEYQLQKQIATYLKTQYPKVLFLSDTVASVKLTAPQQARNKAIQCQKFKCPDLIIFQPNDYYSGLFIELKAESPYLKNGITLKSDSHIQEQYNTLLELLGKGYYATFAWTFEQAKNIIDGYINHFEQLK